MKSYGRVDITWNEQKIRTILDDVLQWFNKHGTKVWVSQDPEGNVIANDPSDAVTKRSDTILVCGVTESGKFYNNVAYVNYSIDEIFPRVRDSLMYGIFDYGNLGFLSEGRMQLRGALNDAEILCKIHGCDFICGYTDTGIMVAPASQAERFADLLSVKVTEQGIQSLATNQDNLTRPVYDLYMAAFGVISYAKFDTEQMCVKKTENALEDMAMLYLSKKRCFRNPGLDMSYNEITMVLRDGIRKPTYKVLMDDLFDGQKILHKKIRDVARDVARDAWNTRPTRSAMDEFIS